MAVSNMEVLLSICSVTWMPQGRFGLFFGPVCVFVFRPEVILFFWNDVKVLYFKPMTTMLVFCGVCVCVCDHQGKCISVETREILKDIFLSQWLRPKAQTCSICIDSKSGLALAVFVLFTLPVGSLSRRVFRRVGFRTEERKPAATVSRYTTYS